ncbi:lamin tail domain-containing protein [Halomicrobium salinisoli]|uniref:lamin tail domain-containing protein n=1 Tax=Halomicrobium salinisoli TaxID=2878391 RepID=UPI001CEFF80E|nr:lamin tail domain-containing protein [Halomicrobium salinisoli]
MTLSRPVRVVAVAAVVVLAGCVGGAVDYRAGPADGEGAASTNATASTATTDAGGNGTLEVHHIDVGQGDSTLVVGPDNETMLIDSGDFTDDGDVVLEYLDARGIDRIDYLVTTHGHADHVGGHAAVIEHYETEEEGVGAVYDPGVAASTQTYEAYLDAVEEHNVTLYETRAGDRIPMAGANVSVLGPPEPYHESGDQNENSLTLRLRYGETGFLFTGDAEATHEEYLVERHGDELGATAFKVGHHGSSTSNTGEFLDAVDPEVAVVSSAYDSEYGHPHNETLARLAERGVDTYWTATHGDVLLESDGETVTAWTQREAPTDPRSLYEGEPIEPGADDSLERRASYEGNVGSEAETPVATDGGTPTATPTEAGDGDGDLVVAEVHADAAGVERENLNDEYVVFENAGDAPLSLSGWEVEDDAGHTYAFPDGFALDPGASVTLHTGSGSDTETDLYWGQGSPVWNNNGDTVIVTDADGERVLTEAYS